ncbi:MAG TPA: hypothetical protein VN039_12920 [Nitrospira sp.]|nr:hypothetical protein [Nitrospira sp.]
MLHTDYIAKLARESQEPNFRPWNIDTHAHARPLGIKKGEKLFAVTYTHEPEVTHIINGRELETIGRFI